jgi:3-deoxy-7-phosphoheptulonate synthase/chorismate mutase
MKENILGSLRKKVNRIDRRLMKDLTRRFGIVQMIGEMKGQIGIPIVDKERERKIVEKIQTLNTDDTTKSAIKKIYECIFDTSYHIEKVEKS